ncbi:MAG: energy transducer TonB [Kiritimatiellae bacterium]|nr:energy transducer TonB [Kiritimatiellia bacterium]
MGGKAFAASLVIHALFVGAFVAGHLSRTPTPAPVEEPCFFELVDESAPGGAGDVSPPAAPDSATPVEPEKEPCHEKPPETPPLPSSDETDSARLQEVRTVERRPTPAVERSSAEEKKTVMRQPSSSMPAVERSDEEHAHVVTAPSALGRIVPVYPRSARRHGREGSVTVEAAVTPDGRAESVSVVAGSGCADLDSAACQALVRARFAPATEDGKKVGGRIRLTFDFRLN